MQELANAIGARLIISPSNNFNTFAIGSIPPQSNVGPWLKDCNQWFVFDDATASYVPIANTTPGGWRNMEFHTTSGTFIVPDFIDKIEVEIWGGGGGGSIGTAGAGRGGGGAGGYSRSILTVTPGQSILYTIGGGGSSGSPGSAGGNSAFLSMTALGGAGAPGTIYGGVGGNATGGIINMRGGSGGVADNATGTGGNGGSSSNGGSGGTDINPLNPLVQDGVVPGGGGAGTGGPTTPGTGASGGVLIRY